MAVCEILAPAGDRQSLEAALNAGADAVYFGLDEGFNARARASNFSLDGLDDITSLVHRAGARAYLTLNTLIFEEELEKVELMLRRIGASGVDALIVQDPAMAMLAQRVCPELELHASTQMTISSPEAVPFATELGITRVVVPRELSVEEIRLFRQGCEVELEVFIMGALCMAWSGQCLSSEAWGGRSANRGQCAQACRLPYQLIVDGEVRDLGQVQYLLSPQDLAGFRAVESLLEIGVHTLKIEGRQKGPQYVFQATTSMRDWVDSLKRGQADEGQLSESLRDLSLTYSRGFGDGFLAGSDHQTLVEGRTPRHRGLYLGTVTKISGKRVTVDPTPLPTRPAEGEVSSPLPAYGASREAAVGAAIAAPQPRPGMGVVFSQGDEQEQEQGGPIFAVKREGAMWSLAFGNPGPNLRRVRRGAAVYLTSDPKLTVKKFPQPQGRHPLTLHCRGEEGQPLTVSARSGPWEVTAHSQSELQSAQKRALGAEQLEENLGALGGTPFTLSELSVELQGDLFLPLSNLRQLRRELVEKLTPMVERPLHRKVHPEPQLPALLKPQLEPVAARPHLVALCRNDEQLEAAIEAGLDEVELDWMELVGLNSSVQRAREAGLRVGLATVRVQKPGEQVFDRRIEKLAPDSVLVRHWAGLLHFRGLEDKPIIHGDFSLNVTNSLTANYLLDLGLSTVTASHDLDQRQLLKLLERVPAGSVCVTIHHHIPTFHTEHCVYSALLSQGRDYRTCGRPCEHHAVSLRDRVGLEHPVIVDVGCRNTVFNACAQSAAFLVHDLAAQGVMRLRVEFVRESRDEAASVLQAYQALLREEISAPEVVERLKVHEQFGVSRGTMRIL